MPALLDAHSFLWLTSDEARLSAASLAYVRDARNRLLLSIAGEWEIAIKHAKGHLDLQLPLEELLVDVPARLSIDCCLSPQRTW